MVIRMIHAVSAHGLASTSPASAPPIREDARVGFVVGMAVLAYQLGASAVDALSAYVLRARHQFKMFRSHAIARVAQMIPLKSRGRLTYEEVMGEHLVEATVAIGHDGGSPEPTAVGFLDLRPEALLRCAVDVFRMGSHRVLQSLVATGQAVQAALPHHFTPVSITSGSTVSITAATILLPEGP